nr:CPPV013 hypothetical protein [Cooks petrelpox virus]
MSYFIKTIKGMVSGGCIYTPPGQRVINEKSRTLFSLRSFSSIST